MKLIEALEIIGKPYPSGAKQLSVGLVCGFSPLHLKTLLASQLRLLLPDHRIEIETGEYGQFQRNLERLEERKCDAGLVVLEWQDLDPRMGLRNLGRWSPRDLDDILENTAARCSQIEQAVRRLSENLVLAFCFPTLPFPAISFAPSSESSAFELQIRAMAASLSAKIAKECKQRIVNLQRLEQLSPPGERFDVDSELRFGFPYKVPHAAAVAETLGRLLQNPTPKKGLITDLDDTLWQGILGEEGVDGISWDLDHHSHMHGAYQRLLDALAESGVLIAVASKNDPTLVEEAFQRKDLVLSPKALFPVEAHWGPKSESVARILKSWNIAADSVVFVDDSAMELAEVKQRYPEMECLLFPAGKNAAVLDFLGQVRGFFGKRAILEEDQVRLDSLRRKQDYTGNGTSASPPPEEFLRQAEAQISLNFDKNSSDVRPLELINKTNQFNLNGKRHTEITWRRYLRDPQTFSVVVSYQDKFGPLGKIAVVAGRVADRQLFVDVWVMSCRAFSRRIEHRCLEELFSRFEVDEVVFDYVPTPRNAPFRSFLAEFAGEELSAPSILSREHLQKGRLETCHQVAETTNG